jgi:hypothetical protein
MTEHRPEYFVHFKVYEMFILTLPGTKNFIILSLPSRRLYSVFSLAEIFFACTF